MKIALVGPGLMSIPPKGWGAVEILIWKYFNKLKQKGHDVVIFNSPNIRKVIREINNSDFDFIHVHYDNFIRDFVKYCKKPFCITSHYGYILKMHKWSKGYFSIFSYFLKAPGIIALSDNISNLYIDSGYKGSLYTLMNGVEVKDFSFSNHGNGRALFLGKIEPRKQQAKLVKMLDGLVHIDFVGPIEDTNFIPGDTCKYLGVWTKDDVRKKLTEYGTLVLFSDGEASPLVVLEALASGVSVVVSSAASENLESNEFIKILSDNSNEEEIASVINDSIKNNTNLRSKIRSYAFSRFDNDIIISNYLAIITDFKHKEKANSLIYDKKPVFIKNNYMKFVMSSLWLFLSQITFLRNIKNFFRV